MRAKAGDPPRTMAQKVFAGRAADPSLSGDRAVVKVDQVVLSRGAGRVLSEAVAMGLKKAAVEVALAYDGHCVTSSRDDVGALQSHELAAHGFLVGRPGVGFAAAVHLERFASPARLCLTDEPRLASSGGVGMLTLLAAPSQLAEALVTGRVALRPPRSVQVQLSGRVRPFVCARDVALELLRRGIGDAVARVEAKYAAPVVLEFTGASVRLLSVAERAVLASLAPELGASASVFTSDERTEVYLRDQRRSKAHRVLAADEGAPLDEVLQVDLAAVDPLLRDTDGKVRAVRDLAGKPVSQALLGGDTGATLRDLLAAAALLKSKRVPSKLDFLLALPTRQAAEVLASEGALTDLLATGARIVEPDARVLSGGLYPVVGEGVAVRTYDPDPAAPGRGFVVASPETLAYAVATGEIGDPRGFKRPVRITVPRELPTDDVLISRDKRGSDPAGKRAAAAPTPAAPWKGSQSLAIVTSAASAQSEPCVVACAGLPELRAAVALALSRPGVVRAIVAPRWPSGLAACAAAVNAAALVGDVASLPTSGAVPMSPPADVVTLGKAKFAWVASSLEREWIAAGSSRVRASK